MDLVYLGAFRMPDYDAASSRVIGVAKAITSEGTNTVKFISWGGHYRESDLDENGNYRTCGFEYVITDEIDIKGSVFKRVIKRFQRGKKTLLYLRSHKRPDVIIAYNPGFSLSCRLLLYSLFTNVKIVCDLTEWYSREELALGFISYEINMRLLLPLIKNKICISSFFEHFYQKSHSIVIPATCDPTDKKWRDIDSTLVEPFDGTTFIYAGSPAKKDKLSIVVSAIDELSKRGYSLRLLVLGLTKEEYEQSFHPVGILCKQVVFLGRKPQQLIPSYYATADFMVLIRNQTRKSNAGFPTKVAEAMTAGCPVIANLTSDLGNILQDSYNALVVSDSTYGQLVSVLERAVNLPNDVIVQMKENVRKTNYVFDCAQYGYSINSFLNSLV